MLHRKPRSRRRHPRPSASSRASQSISSPAKRKAGAEKRSLNASECFGAFATPEENILFDINDFDETLPGVDFTVDLKRLLLLSLTISVLPTPRVPRLMPLLDHCRGPRLSAVIHKKRAPQRAA